MAVGTARRSFPGEGRGPVCAAGGRGLAREKARETGQRGTGLGPHLLRPSSSAENEVFSGNPRAPLQCTRSVGVTPRGWGPGWRRGRARPSPPAARSSTSGPSNPAPRREPVCPRAADSQGRATTVSAASRWTCPGFAAGPAHRTCPCSFTPGVLVACGQRVFALHVVAFNSPQATY